MLISFGNALINIPQNNSVNLIPKINHLTRGYYALTIQAWVTALELGMGQSHPNCIG
jgi:hypothetical protein